MVENESRVWIQETNIENDIGVHNDSELKFSKHVEIQTNKANNILYLIRCFTYLDRLPETPLYRFS